MNFIKFESILFSLERLYPMSLVEVSKSKKNIGSEKNFGSKRNFGSTKNFGSKTIVCLNKNLTSKNFESEKNFKSEKTFWGMNNLGFQKKILCPKKFRVQ